MSPQPFPIYEVGLFRALLEAGVADLAELIERAIEQIDRYGDMRYKVGDQTLRRIVDTMRHFAEHDIPPNPTAWPMEELRIMAAFVSLPEAAELLNIDAQDLNRGMQATRPWRPWSWWHALGQGIRRGVKPYLLAQEFKTTPKLVMHYAKQVVVPRTNPDRFIERVREGAYPPIAAVEAGYSAKHAVRLMARLRPLDDYEEEAIKDMARAHLGTPGRTRTRVAALYGVEL